MNIQVKDFIKKEKNDFCSMVTEFYNSDAVSHNIPKKNIMQTFDMHISKSPFVRCLVLEYDNKKAGFALLSFTHSTEAGGLVVLLEDLFVKLEFRGKGIVSKFFEFLFNAYDKKAARYRLEVTATNKKAIEIYSHYGFETLEYSNMVKDMMIS